MSVSARVWVRVRSVGVIVWPLRVSRLKSLEQPAACQLRPCLPTSHQPHTHLLPHSTPTSSPTPTCPIQVRPRAVCCGRPISTGGPRRADDPVAPVGQRQDRLRRWLLGAREHLSSEFRVDMSQRNREDKLIRLHLRSRRAPARLRPQAGRRDCAATRAPSAAARDAACAWGHRVQSSEFILAKRQSKTVG